MAPLEPRLGPHLEWGPKLLMWGQRATLSLSLLALASFLVGAWSGWTLGVRGMF